MQKAAIYENLSYQDGDKPHTDVLFVSEFSREIRIVFKKGQFMKEHETPFPIVVEVVDGQIDFGIDGGVEHLGKGDLITLAGGHRHDLIALTDSVVRLTISLGRTVPHPALA